MQFLQDSLYLYATQYKLAIQKYVVLRIYLDNRHRTDVLYVHGKCHSKWASLV